MIQTNKLSFAYRSGPPLAFPDIHCRAGESWLLLGNSGSGKTTFLHLLAGLLTPSEGSVIIDQVSLGSLSAAALDKYRGRKVGLVFQKPHFVQSLTVAENLALARHLAGLPVDSGRIHSLLDRLRIGHKYGERTDRLSQGEQQRVAIARAIVNQPSVILADEPTSALDDQNAKEVTELLEENARAVDATLLVVTHDQRLKERFAHRIELTT